MATATKTDRERIDEARAELDGGVDDGIDLDPQDVHDGDQLTMFEQLIGGKAATSSTTRLLGGKLDLDHEFTKGQRIVLRIEAEVSGVGYVDQHDPKTGQVVGCERRHSARITGIKLQKS